MRQRCVEVAAPYKLYINKIVQNLWVDNILPYYTHPSTPNKAKIHRIKKINTADFYFISLYISLARVVRAS